MAGRPILRPVDAPEPGEHLGEREAPLLRPRARPPAWAPAALAIALALVVALLIWSRVQLGAQIETLTGEVRVLQEQVASRDRLIAVQGARISTARQGLDDLGARIEELQTTLAKPVPTLE